MKNSGVKGIHTMKDYHLKGPLGYGFYFSDFGVELDSDYESILSIDASLGYTLPSLSLRVKQSDLVTALKAAGVWALLDVFYIFRNNDSTLSNHSKLNWKNPSSFEITSTTFPSYTVNGWDGNGTDQFLSTNWNPTANGLNFTQNDGSMFASQFENVAAGHTLIGVADAGGTNITRITPRNATDLSIYQVNCNTLDTGANTDASGFWHARRTASNATSLFKNGVSVDSTTNSVNARANSTVSLLALNTAGTNSAFSGQTIGCAGIGASMSAQQSADLYTAINNYFSSL